MLLLTEADIRKLFSMEEALSVVETAFKDYALGNSKMPSKVYLNLPEFSGDFRAMPAYSFQHQIAGVKWVNSHSKNPQKGLPSVMALLILNDPATAVPLAILEGSFLTNMRTGAAGAVAAKYLAKKDASITAFVGSGQQAYYQALALLKIFKLTELRIFDTHAESKKTFSQKIKDSFNISIHDYRSLPSCLEGAHIVVTTTPSHTPLVLENWILPGTHINAIGADAPGKQELDANLVKKSRIVVDDLDQASHSGEINMPLKEHLISSSDIQGTLGDLILGKYSGRQVSSDITLFDSTGLAIQDIAAGAYIYKKAKKMGIGETISFWETPHIANIP